MRISSNESSLSSFQESHFVPRSPLSSMEPHTPEANAVPHNDHTMQIQPSLVEDDEKSRVSATSGIVGATICFTPEASPRASPRVLGDATTNSNSTNYIGNIDELEGEKLVSSAMHIASSLDDRSTTEYELLDGIESKGSVEVEDLDLDDDEVTESLLKTVDTIKLNEKIDAALEKFLESPPSSLPSSDNDGEAVQENLELPVLSEESQFNLNESGDGTAFSRTTKSMLTHMSKLGKDDASIEGDAGSTKVDDIINEENASNTSSMKVDVTPLSTLKILKDFWENPFLGNTEKVNADGLEKQDQPVVALDSNSVGLNSQASSKHSQTPTRHDAVSSQLSTGSFLSTIGLVIWLWVQHAMLACGKNLSQVDKVCRSLRNIILSRTEPTAGFVEVLDDDDNEADLDEAVDPSRVNLTSLFDNDDVALGQRKPALDEPVGFVAFKANSGSLGWKLYASSASMLVVVWRFVVRFFSAIESADAGASEHVCFTTNTTSYDSIPIWEINLSPMDNTHFEMHVSSSLPKLFFFVSIVIALVTASVAKPEVLKHFLSKLPFQRSPKQLRGIWSAEEHEQFIYGFERHGTNWKLVVPFIPTRNYAQVKKHGDYWLKVKSPETMKRSRRVDVNATPKPLACAVSGLMTPVNTTPITNAISGHATPKVSNMTPSDNKKRDEELARAREYGKQLREKLYARSAKQTPKTV